MTPEIIEFPHHGEHLDNDHSQADLTMLLLLAFVIFMVLMFVVAFA